jgi:hypothetical protein
MMTFIRPRLRVPVRDAALGTVFALAWIVRGGPLWWVPIQVAIATAVRVVTVYRRGNQDSDEGALVGSRADERQKLLSVRSRALAGTVALIAAFAGLTIAIAVGASWWWPFVVMLAVTGFAYLFGFSTYSAAEEVPAGEPNDGHGVPSPVSP